MLILEHNILFIPSNASKMYNEFPEASSIHPSSFIFIIYFSLKFSKVYKLTQSVKQGTGISPR